MKQALLQELKTIELFFDRSTSCLTEEDSGFKPTDEMLTVAHQVAHVAQSVDWFVDGMKSEAGFDMDFEAHWVAVTPIVSLQVAREWVSRSFTEAAKVVEEMTEEQLLSPFPEGIVMGGAPRMAGIDGISDHTAHHRGALTVYSRLLGNIPAMPYMD